MILDLVELFGSGEGRFVPLEGTDAHEGCVFVDCAAAGATLLLFYWWDGLSKLLALVVYVGSFAAL